MKKLMVLSLLILMGASVDVSAQSNNKGQKGEKILVDVNDLPPGLAEQLKTKQKIKQMGEWAGLGKEIGEAINNSLAAITDNAEKFADTRVGTFTMVLVAWKVIGNDLTQFMVGVPLLFIGLIFFIVILCKNCMTKRILVKEEGEKKEYLVHEPSDEVRIGHFICFVIFIVVCLFVILV
jgi:hypothetical protein